MADYVGMTPTVVIGLGGTGKEILIKIRRMIVESYGSLDALPIVSFLHIDTEQNAKVSEPQTVLKQNISLRPSEQVWAKVENAKAMLNQLSSYDYLAEWFPSQLRGTDSILAGAGQIRSLGKFAFSVNYQIIKNSFNNALARIVGHEKFLLDKLGLQLDKGVNIFIVCSLSGGTGSGMVLDLAYNLRDWVPPSAMPQTSAYLVLPGAFSGLGDRVIANAYAALMELNHYSRNDTRFECQYSSNASDRITSQSSQDVPFNFCYLVGNSNDKVTLASLNSVLEMVAQNVFLDFSSGFSQYKKLVRDNIRKQWASPDSLGYPQSFIAFGLASIQFPIQRVLQACASRLAKRVVTWWENPTPAPGAMRDLIQTEILPSLNLSESDSQHQLLDSISLGNNMKPYTKEVADWVAILRKRRNDLNIPFENIQRFVSVEQEKYSPHFNDGDTDPRRWSDYFQKMWDNLNRLKTQKRQELRQIVHQMIEDRFRGPKFVRQFLEVLLEVFNNYRSQFDQERQKTFLPKEQSAANALQVLLKQIDNHAKQFNPLNKKTVIEEDFNGIMQALQSIYTSKVEVKSRTLGVLLLDAFKEEINSLIIDLTAFDQVLETLQSQLSDREQTYIGETGTLTVNGILLYNPKDVDQVFNQVLEGKTETIFQTVSQDILDDLGIHLFDLYSFDTLRIKDLFERLLNRSVDEFIDKSQLQVSTARKFLEHYPTLEQQEAQIKTTFEKSEPFLRFSQEQVNLGWENKIEKRQTLIGIQGGNKPSDVAVAAILPQIRKSSTLTDKDIRPLNDPHHIFFVQEVGAFPLLLIEGMEKMRVIYRTISQTDKNPLHTHQDYRQFQDIMPSSQEEVQVKQNLLLAKALGLIIQHENKVTGFDEIRFPYQDKQTGIEKVQVLGENWQKAQENLLNDQNRKVRDILADSLKKIGENATTKPQKQQLYQKLIGCLKEIENTFIGGKDNPDYHKGEAALEEYIKQYSLMIISPSLNSSVVTEPKTISATPQNNENLEKFRKLVVTCYKHG
ncbi:MAG: tubulin-like doman-containing protein, partial [Nostoc sp.]